MKLNPKVFIQTNKFQNFGARLAAFSFIKNSEIDVDISFVEAETVGVAQLFGKTILRSGQHHRYKNDLQSFTPVRFFVPEIMNYKGAALVIDPDVFCVRISGNDWRQLFDFIGRYSITAVQASPTGFHSSVMGLDCRRLHWSSKAILEKLERMTIDYTDLMKLREEVENIKPLDPRFNQFDKIDRHTVFLHTTERATQPWRTGLPTNFEKKRPKAIKSKFLSVIAPQKFEVPKFHLQHPCRRVDSFVAQLLVMALDEGYLSESDIDSAILSEQVRPDVYEWMKMC